jgi:trimeric autotransporter adhesin
MQTKRLLLSACIIVLTCAAFAQVPQAMNYQAVLRNTQGSIMPNTNACVRFSVIDSLIPGFTIYQETQTITTNTFGLFTVQVGRGAPITGIFANIDWAHNNKYLMVELDLGCTGTYVNDGIAQLLSVPYAFYAQNSGGAAGWNLTGNAGTTTGTNFIGTTDSTDLQLRVNNRQAGIIEVANSNQSTAFGYEALAKEVANQSSGNLAIGYGALYTDSVGKYNSALGYQALYNNTVGVSNTVTGFHGLFKNTTGISNCGLSAWAMSVNTTGSENSAVGYGALGQNTTGNRNTGMGAWALFTNRNGTGNTGLGYGADVADSNLTNATAIGAYAIAGQSNSIVLGGTGNKAVKVGIGTTTPNFTLDINTSNSNADGIGIINLDTTSQGRLMFTEPNGQPGTFASISRCNKYTAGTIQGIAKPHMLEIYNYYDMMFDNYRHNMYFTTFGNNIGLALDSNGRLGVGTFTPSTLLDVEGGGITRI